MRDDDLEGLVARYHTRVAPVRFRAGFADRVMARMEAAVPLGDRLYGAFVRLIPLAAAAALFLAAMNVRSSHDREQPAWERALGLPAVTLAAAYEMAPELDVAHEVDR